MRTTDFKDFGNFYKNKDGVISFVSLLEEQVFNERNFISENSFEKFDSEIPGAFIDPKLGVYDFVNIAKTLNLVNIPVFIGDFEFPRFLNISIEESPKKDSFFPLSQVCKALACSQQEFKPFETENRLVLTDYATKMPKSGDVVVFPTIVKGYKTVYPKSYDAWVKLLLKAKEFKTMNKDFLMLKSLFNIL